MQCPFFFFWDIKEARDDYRGIQIQLPIMRIEISGNINTNRYAFNVVPNLRKLSHSVRFRWETSTIILRIRGQMERAVIDLLLLFHPDTPLPC